MAVIAVLIALGSGESLPEVGSHWHAGYTIEICGETLPPRPASPGDVHTHGDGLIHVHPSTYRTAGENANLARFVASIGGTLRDSVLDVPGRRTLRNGDRCQNGEEGRVAVYVNGDRIAEPAAYVPQDGDEVRIAFEPATERED